MSWQQHAIVVFIHTVNKTSCYLKIMAPLFRHCLCSVYNTYDQELHVQVEEVSFENCMYANSQGKNYYKERWQDPVGKTSLTTLSMIYQHKYKNILLTH